MILGDEETKIIAACEKHYTYMQQTVLRHSPDKAYNMAMLDLILAQPLKISNHLIPEIDWNQ